MVGQGLCPNQEAYNHSHNYIISLLRALEIDLAMGVYRHMPAQCHEQYVLYGNFTVGKNPNLFLKTCY